MLLRNTTLNGQRVDVEVTDGVISAIGDLPAGGTGAGATSTEVIDAGGRWLVPGLWDNHVHFSQWAMGSRRLDLGDAASAAEAVTRVASAMAEETRRAHGDDLSAETYVAVGFRDGLWPDVPTIDILDAVSAIRPIVLVSADLHAVWLNSPALHLYGHDGHPTGLLREDPAFEVTRRINTIDPNVLDGWAGLCAETAASRGVVGIVDLEMDWNLDNWQRRIAGGTTSLRVEFGIYSEHLERAIALGLRTGQRVNDLLTVGGFKVLTDGSLNTRTAYCYDEYPGHPGEDHSHGMLTVPPEELIQRMRRAVESGIVPDVHAIGDHANSLALDAFALLGSGGTIEHAQLVSEADFARFAQLGVVASVQPEHAMDDRDVADVHWAGRTGRSFALRSLLDAGATLAFGSDAPVAPLDPWVTMAAATSRRRGDREPWHPEQAITMAEAITASSRTTVDVGQPADLVLVERDPLVATDAELRQMPVAATILGGRFTHSTL